MWLSRSDRSRDENSENIVKITGNYSFHVAVEFQGTKNCQDQTISIKAQQKQDRRLVIATKCKWYQIKKDRQYLIPGINSNTYQCSANDIGTVIKCEVSSQEQDEFPGTAICHIGPIQLEPQTKSRLENILGNGGNTFQLNRVGSDGKVETQPSNLKISKTHFNLQEQNYYSYQQQEKNINFQHQIDFPQIELHPYDTKKLQFIFQKSINPFEFDKIKQQFSENNTDLNSSQNSQYSKKYSSARKSQQASVRSSITSSQKDQTQIILSYHCTSRQERDLTILSLRCFSIYNYLVYNKIIQNQDILSSIQNLPQKDNIVQDKFQSLFEYENYQKEQKMIIGLNQQLQKENGSQKKEIVRLEEEISNTISSYTTLIQDLKHSNNQLQTNRSFVDNPLQNQENSDKIRNLERENEELKSEIQTLIKNHFLEQNRVQEQEDSRLIFKSQIQDISYIQQEESELVKSLKKENESLKQKLSKSPPKNDNNNSLQEKYELEKQNNKLLLKELQRYQLDDKYSSNLNSNVMILQKELESVQAQLQFEKSRKSGQSSNQSVQIKNLEEKIRQSNQNNEHLRSQLSQYQSQYSTNHNSQQFLKENETLKKEIEVLVGKNEMLRSQIKEQSKVGSTAQNLTPIKSGKEILYMSQQNQLQSKFSPVQNTEKIQNLQEKNHLLEKQIEALKQENEILKNNTAIGSSMIQESNIFINQQQMQKLEQTVQEAKKLNTNLKNDLHSYKEKNTELEKQNKQLKFDLNFLQNNQKDSQSGHVNQEEKDKLLDQRNQLLKKIDSLQKELDKKHNLSQNTQKLQHLLSQNEKLLIENGNLMEQNKNLEQKLLQAQKNTQNLNNSYDSSVYSQQIHNQQHFAQLENMNQILIQQNEEYKKQIMELRKNQQTLQDQIQEQKSRQFEDSYMSQKLEKDEKILNEIRQYKQQIDKLMKSNESLFTENHNLMNENAKLQDQIFELRNRSFTSSMQQIPQQHNNSQQEKEIENLKEELKLKDNMIDQLKKTNEKLLQANMQLTQQNQQLQDEIDMKQSFISRQSFDDNHHVDQNIHNNFNNINTNQIIQNHNNNHHIQEQEKQKYNNNHMELDLDKFVKEQSFSSKKKGLTFKEFSSVKKDLNQQDLFSVDAFTKILSPNANKKSDFQQNNFNSNQQKFDTDNDDLLLIHNTLTGKETQTSNKTSNQKQQTLQSLNPEKITLSEFKFPSRDDNLLSKYRTNTEINNEQKYTGNINNNNNNNLPKSSNNFLDLL